MDNGPRHLQPWMVFALPAGIAVPIIVAILLAGPVAGFAVAGLLALVIVAAAVRKDRRGSPSAAHDWRRTVLRFIVPVALAIAGAVLAVVSDGTLRVVGWGVIAVAITLAISLVFLEVGYSEDRARAREDARPDGAGSAPTRLTRLRRGGPGTR